MTSKKTIVIDKEFAGDLLEVQDQLDGVINFLLADLVEKGLLITCVTKNGNTTEKEYTEHDPLPLPVLQMIEAKNLLFRAALSIEAAHIIPLKPKPRDE